MTWLSDYLYDRIQQLIRNPQYLSDIKDVLFDSKGFEIPGMINKVSSIRDKWQLDTLISPAIKVAKGDIESLPIFRDTMAVTADYCRYEREMTPDEKASVEKLPPTKFEGKDEAVLCEDEPETILESTPIWNDHFIRLTVDVNPGLNIEAVLGQVRDHINQARGQLEAKNQRLHFEKRADYYRVWDLRKEKKPFKQIAKELKIFENDAKRHFYIAYELILQKPFDKLRWNTILSEKLRSNVWKDGAYDKEAAEKYLDHDGHSRSLRTVPIQDDITAAETDGFDELAFDLKAVCGACTDTECRENIFLAIEYKDFSGLVPCPNFFEIAELYRPS